MSRGAELLRGWGLDVRVSHQVTALDGYLAGSDMVRLESLTKAITDPDIDIVWAARGGYGVVRLLAKGLPPAAPSNPPWVVGFSDISLLLLHLSRRGWPCVHGPNIATLPDLSEADFHALHAVLFEGHGIAFDGMVTVVPGLATGPIAPMNWTVLCSVIGTNLLPDLSGNILLLEDVHEAAYALDRHLVQLSQTPWFRLLSGVVFGDLGGAQQDPRLRASIQEVMSDAKMPCAMGAPVGHGQRLAAIPVGRIVTLDGGAGTLKDA